MSVRQKLENELVSFLNKEKLNDSYGVITEHHGRYRSVTFCRSKITDAEIRIYGPNFLLLKWQTGNRSLPFNGQEKFKSVDGLKEFIRQHF